MASVVCSACGEATEIPNCPSCGAELLSNAAAQDQTSSDGDQTASDQDQTWSDHDQSASERDQRSADDDQDAADDEFAAGGNAAAHERGTVARERSSHDREAVSHLRDKTAAARFRVAEDRDRAASLRDRGAEARDALARLHDLQSGDETSPNDILARAERDRARAAADRVKAASDRARAAADREEAARERADALRERSKSEDDIRRATTDDLTGARTRMFGLEEASRELERAHRTGIALVLAFIDVNGLKEVNDSEGHLAGDELLQVVGETIRANVRPYDVIVRYGGDEFVCAMPNISAPEARARFEKIAAALAAVRSEHSVTFGIAAAKPHEGIKELLARADADLLEVRRGDSR